MNKIKIIATINNSSNSLEVIEKLILNGVDAIKINMNDVNFDDARKIIDSIKTLNKKLDTGIGIIVEIGEPKLHLGKMNTSSYFKTGDKIRIYTIDTIGDSTKASINNKEAFNDVFRDNYIYTPHTKLKVYDKGDDYIICEVLSGGDVFSYDEVYINKEINAPYLRIKDIKDIEFASTMKVDYIMLPHVKSIDDVMQVTDLLIGLKNDHTSIISKIDSKEATNNIDEIIKISEGILIDRNSLSMEIPMERIPGIQKTIINKSLRSGKVSLVSIDLPDNTPSRIEVQDIANACLDGVDAILINDNINHENLPIKQMKSLESILKEVEDSIDYEAMLYNANKDEGSDITGMIASNVAMTSFKLKCKAIIAPTITGYTARKISRFRPQAPIIAVSPNMETVTSLSIHFGIAPVLIDDLASLDKIIKTSESIAACLIELKHGDKIIITGGYPFKETKNTNFMKIEEI